MLNLYYAVGTGSMKLIRLGQHANLNMYYSMQEDVPLSSFGGVVVVV